MCINVPKAKAPEAEHWMVKAILSTTTEGRKVVDEMKKIDAQRAAREEKQVAEEMDRTTKVKPLLSFLKYRKSIRLNQQRWIY